MRQIRSPRSVQRQVERWRQDGLKVGLVPTMGALHEGHLSLIRAARRQCDRIITSIFVNPTQFGPKEDLNKYPRPFKRDLTLLRDANCDLVFAPPPADMYPAGFDTYVVPGELATILEGKSRPGHFRGVATVCLKLFTICKPHIAYFGQKDFQQTVVLQRMVADLNLDLKLSILPTVRERDGLALSSRNVYLSDAERETALAISRTLRATADLLRSGNATPAQAERKGLSTLNRVRGLLPDYFVVRNALTLAEPTRADRRLVILAAARVGKTRLIDNLPVRLK